MTTTTKPRTYKSTSDAPDRLWTILWAFDPNTHPAGTTWDVAIGFRRSFNQHYRNARDRAVVDGLLEEITVGQSLTGYRLTDAGIAILKLVDWKDERTGHATLDALCARVVGGENISTWDADRAVSRYYDGLRTVVQERERVVKLRKRELDAQQAAADEATRLGVPLPTDTLAHAQQNRETYEAVVRSFDEVLAGAKGALDVIAQREAEKDAQPD